MLKYSYNRFVFPRFQIQLFVAFYKVLKDFSGDTASGETTDGRSPDDCEAMAVLIAVGIWEAHSHLDT